MSGFTVTRIKAFPPPARGEIRKWIKCVKHGRVYSQDYVPYSLSNPIMWLDCGCSPYRSRGEKDTVNITEPEALTQIFCEAIKFSALQPQGETDVG